MSSREYQDLVDEVLTDNPIMHAICQEPIAPFFPESEATGRREGVAIWGSSCLLSAASSRKKQAIPARKSGGVRAWRVVTRFPGDRDFQDVRRKAGGSSHAAYTEVRILLPFEVKIMATSLCHACGAPMYEGELFCPKCRSERLDHEGKRSRGGLWFVLALVAAGTGMTILKMLGYLG